MAKGKPELKMLSRLIVAYVIGVGLLYAMTLYVGQYSNTSSLTQVMRIWGLVLIIDAVISISYILFPSKK